MHVHLIHYTRLYSTWFHFAIIYHCFCNIASVTIPGLVWVRIMLQFTSQHLSMYVQYGCNSVHLSLLCCEFEHCIIVCSCVQAYYCVFLCSDQPWRITVWKGPVHQFLILSIGDVMLTSLGLSNSGIMVQEEWFGREISIGWMVWLSPYLLLLFVLI